MGMYYINKYMYTFIRIEAQESIKFETICFYQQLIPDLLVFYKSGGKFLANLS